MSLLRRIKLSLPSPSSDRLFWLLLAAGFLLDSGIWTYLAARYSSLPALLPIHYDSVGTVDRVGLRAQLFILPSIGLAVLGANTALSSALYRRDKQVCYLMLSVAILVQLLLWAASVRLVH